MAKKTKLEKRREARQLAILSSRLRRWRDIRELTNESAAETFGMPVSTYEDALYGLHLPRRAVLALLLRHLASEERKLQLEPITK